MQITDSGQIVVAGTWIWNNEGVSFVNRLNADGSDDSTFGQSQTAWTDSNFGRLSEVHSAAVQSDGKILVAGGNPYYNAVARYNSDGSEDTSFGGPIVPLATMYYPTTGTTSGTKGRAVALEGDGKIVAAGFGYGSNYFLGIGNSAQEFLVGRFNADGTADTGFGTNGFGSATTDFTSYGSRSEAYAMALQADGRIALAGHSDAGGIQEFALARYTASGTLDSTFGNSGEVTSFGGPLNFDLALNVSVAPGAATVGSPVTYTITATNNGPDSVAEIGSSIAVSSALEPFACGYAYLCPMPFEYNFGLLKPSQSASYTVSSQVACNLPPRINTAPVSAEILGPSGDTNLSNNSASAAVAITDNSGADLALNVDGQNTVKSGDTLTYTFNVHNKKSGPAVLATFDGGMSGGNIQAVSTTQGSCTSGTLQCNLGTIPSSGGVRVKMVALVSATAGSIFTATAGANACTFDPVTTNNTVSATTKVTP